MLCDKQIHCLPCIIHNFQYCAGIMPVFSWPTQNCVRIPFLFLNYCTLESHTKARRCFCCDIGKQNYDWYPDAKIVSKKGIKVLIHTFVRTSPNLMPPNPALLSTRKTGLTQNNSPDAKPNQRNNHGNPPHNTQCRCSTTARRAAQQPSKEQPSSFASKYNLPPPAIILKMLSGAVQKSLSSPIPRCAITRVVHRNLAPQLLSSLSHAIHQNAFSTAVKIEAPPSTLSPFVPTPTRKYR